jgi:protein involved in sex pheromone biosynthesis
MSKRFFSTKTYLFQEGQYLDSETIDNWLERFSDKNPTGLNPADNGRTDNGRTPMYIQSILEDDFMNQVSDDEVDLKAMTIGIAMNRSDSYTKVKYGDVYTQSISYDEMVLQGKQAAQKVLTRLRDKKDVGDNLPILIVMYENASNDSIVGGRPYAYYLSKRGTAILNWKDTNIQNVVFPYTDADTPKIGGSENTQFNNFQTNIKNFFPTLSTATAQGQFENGILIGLKINISTAFYSVSEIKALTSKVQSMLPSYFSNSIPITVTVKGSNQPLAIINKPSDEAGEITYLFSY